jgi:hypothetical protein
MPRPSDVYATLGAPGVYQATSSCTSFRLPNVYVSPPEEDNQDAYCLFHAGSASPTAFESFYRHPACTQSDPNSPTFTDLGTLDHVLSYFQRQSSAYGNAKHGPRSSWEPEEWIQSPPPRNFPGSTASPASSRSSLSDSLRNSSATVAEAHIRSDARHLVETEEEQHGEQRWQEMSTPPSRRSSVFSDRPPQYDISKCPAREEDQPASKKAQTMTLRSRAAMALKGLGDAMTRRLEGDVSVSERRKHEYAHEEHAIHESWFEPSEGLRRKRSRRTLGRLFGSHSNVDIHSVYSGDIDEHAAEVPQPPQPSPPLSSGWDPSLNRRKSMTHLFDLARSSVGLKANMTRSHIDADHPAAAAISKSKLSRRKSMTQLFGIGRGTSPTALSDHTIVPVDGDDDDEPSTTMSPSLSKFEVPFRSVRSGSPVSLAASGATAPLPNRRKYFLSKRRFSFLDLHRRFATDSGSRPSQTPEAHQYTPPAPAVDSTVPFSPDSLSERTASSSSVAVSTEGEQTTEDEVCFPESNAEVMVHIPAIVREGGLVKDLEPSLISGVRLGLSEDSSFPPSFGLDTPDEDDVESEAGEGHPTMELAVRLDSLTFDQLVFDPESFTGTIYD